MNPEDDPEARIRELERPLADTARTSELGGAQPPGGYTYPPGPPVPPAPPPLTYGGPFPGTSPRSPAGMRVWWILAAFFVIGVIALASGIAVYSAHRLSRDSLTILFPTPSITPNSPGTNTTGAQAPSAGPSTSPAPPAGGDLGVSGINENQTMACNDSIVIVSGISNTVEITGHCASLTVSGVENSVTVDAVDTIEASGFNNQVTYHTGSPRINRIGDSNVVRQG
ncbi:MAG: DUF3060 domain-containing protein [Mycobacterium sp.]